MPPPKPIDIRALCASEGECVLGNARFLVDGDTLFLQALAPADVVPSAAPATIHPRDPDAFRSTEEPSLRSSTSSASHADESCDREVEIAPGDVVCADLNFDDDDAFRVPVSPKPNPKADTLEPSPAEGARACGDDDERVAEAEDRDAVRIAEGTSSPVRVDGEIVPSRGAIRLEPGAIVELAIGKGGGTYLYEVNRQVHAHAWTRVTGVESTTGNRRRGIDDGDRRRIDDVRRRFDDGESDDGAHAHSRPRDARRNREASCDDAKIPPHVSYDYFARSRAPSSVLRPRRSTVHGWILLSFSLPQSPHAQLRECGVWIRRYSPARVIFPESILPQHVSEECVRRDGASVLE